MLTEIWYGDYVIVTIKGMTKAIWVFHSSEQPWRVRFDVRECEKLVKGEGGAKKREINDEYDKLRITVVNA